MDYSLAPNIIDLIGPRGGKREIWIRKEAFIGKFIRENKLTAVPTESLHDLVAGGVIVNGRHLMSLSPGMLGEAMASRSATRTKKSIPFPFPWPPPGGIKGPHIHFKGDVFLLDESKWRDFSSAILKDVSSRISRAKSVNFDQLMEISDAVDSLP